MQLLNTCGRDGCGICRKEEEKEIVLSYSTFVFFFLSKTWSLLKSKLSLCAKQFLILDDVANMHVLLPSKNKKKQNKTKQNKKKKLNLIKGVQGFFSFIF